MKKIITILLVLASLVGYSQGQNGGVINGKSISGKSHDVGIDSTSPNRFWLNVSDSITHAHLPLSNGKLSVDSINIKSMPSFTVTAVSSGALDPIDSANLANIPIQQIDGTQKTQLTDASAQDVFMIPILGGNNSVPVTVYDATGAAASINNIQYNQNANTPHTKVGNLILGESDTTLKAIQTDASGNVRTDSFYTRKFIYIGNFPSCCTINESDSIKYRGTIGINNVVPVSQSGTWNVGLSAGSNLVGKFGIDQTTVGTTNAVSLAQIGATTVATGNGVVGAGVQRVAIASDNSPIPISGTVTTTGLDAVDSANLATIKTNVNLSQNGAAVGMPGTLMLGVTSASNPTETDGRLNAPSFDLRGNLRVVTGDALVATVKATQPTYADNTTQNLNMDTLGRLRTFDSTANDRLEYTAATVADVSANTLELVAQNTALYLNTPISDSITALNDYVEYNVGDLRWGSARVVVAGTYTGVLTLEIKDAGTSSGVLTYTNIFYNLRNGAWYSAIPSGEEGEWVVNLHGASRFRIIAATSFTGGCLVYIQPDINKMTDNPNLGLSQGATTSGKFGNMPLVSTTTGSPTNTTGTLNPISATVKGGLRVTMIDSLGNVASFSSDSSLSRSTLKISTLAGHDSTTDSRTTVKVSNTVTTSLDSSTQRTTVKISAMPSITLGATATYDSTRTSTTMTITNLNSLASSATAGWGSDTVRNNVRQALDYRIFVKLDFANTSPANDKAAYVYISAMYYDGTNWYNSSQGTTTTPTNTEGTTTIASPNNLRLLGVLNYQAADAVVEDNFLLSNAYGNNMPDGFKIVIINYTGASIASSGNVVAYTPINRSQR